RERGAGRGRSRRIPGLQAIAGRSVVDTDHREDARRKGAEDDLRQGRPTRNVPTSEAERTAFVLTDPDILTLARWACVIEDHYGCPMDMEWAKDGDNNELFIVQARPETVQSRRQASAL